MLVPDKELMDVWNAKTFREGWCRREGVSAFSKIRSSKLKAESASIKKKLIEEKGKCEVCGFSFKPILQTHHILPISEYGNNDPGNIICVCPNCHKAIHCIYSAIKKDDEAKILEALSYGHVGDVVQNNLISIADKYIEKKTDVTECEKHYMRSLQCGA